MEIYVACDVCGHRYVLSADRQGRNAKCKSCGVSFQVDSDNYYDPETSEDDEPDEDEDTGERSSSLSPIWDLARQAAHGVAGLITFGILIWMGSLLFRSPQAAADMASSGPAASSSGSMPNTFPEVGRPSRPTFPAPNQFRPQPQAPFVPPQPPFGPPQPPFGQPQIKPMPRTPGSPPVTDGSLGWPKAEPDSPSPNPAPTTTARSTRTSPKSRNSDLTVGQSIQVEKDGEWIEAIVRKLEGNGTIRVHYRGRSQGDDESVPRDRIRTR